MEDDANDNPLPMRISVANLIDQEGCFVTLKAESRDLQLWRLSKRRCVNAQPRLVKQNLVNQVVQANPLAPSLLNSQVMQGNPMIVAWLLLDWEGSDKKQLCQLRKIKCVHCRGVKPQDNPTTLSITTLVSTEPTEEVNNDGEPFAEPTVNL
jgi:hypothetical protein